MTLRAGERVVQSGPGTFVLSKSHLPIMIQKQAAENAKLRFTNRPSGPSFTTIAKVMIAPMKKKI